MKKRQNELLALISTPEILKLKEEICITSEELSSQGLFAFSKKKSLSAKLRKLSAELRLKVAAAQVLKSTDE
jgi:hypothetical protein